MSRSCFGLGVSLVVSVVGLACGPSGSTLTPSSPLASSATLLDTGSSSSRVGAHAEEPPFNIEAILRGDGFGLVKFRQVRDSAQNIIDLDVWARDLLPNTSYSLQRATDTTLDDVCTGTNWLTLGQGPVAQAIVTDDTGSGRASLWRDLSFLPSGTPFDIHFRVVQSGTSTVALQSDCYRFVVRD